MASGTKHFLYNRREDWEDMGLIQGLSAGDGGLCLEKAGEGTYISRSLDTLENGTVWHRLRLESTLPDNARLELFVYCSDEDTAPFPGESRQKLDDWLEKADGKAREEFFRRYGQKSWDDPQDLTLYGLQGRYLWFCLFFHSYDGEAMQVHSIKLEFPRIAFIDYLPQVYRGADSRDSFLARFLSLFQSIYVDLEEDIDQMPARCDPAVTSPEFLRFLGEMLAVPQQGLWPEGKLRSLLKQAAGLYRIKGTRRALEQVVELYTGYAPRIVEQFEPASQPIWRQDQEALERLYGKRRQTFTVLMPGKAGGPEEYARLYQIIQSFKPVDAVCNLVFMNDELILGQHCYLGMNSILGRSRGLVLDGGAVPSAPYLAQSATGGRTNEQSAI